MYTGQRWKGTCVKRLIEKYRLDLYRDYNGIALHFNKNKKNSEYNLHDSCSSGYFGTEASVWLVVFWLIFDQFYWDPFHRGEAMYISLIYSELVHK